MAKTETSTAFTPLERQVLGILHRLVYERDGDFYTGSMHDHLHALGAIHTRYRPRTDASGGVSARAGGRAGCGKGCGKGCGTGCGDGAGDRT